MLLNYNILNNIINVYVLSLKLVTRLIYLSYLYW